MGCKNCSGHILDAEASRILAEALASPVKELTSAQREAIRRYKELVKQ